MILVHLPTYVLEVMPHLDRGLRHLGEVGVFEVALANGLLHLGVEQRIASNAVEVGDKSCSVERHPLCAPYLAQQVDQRPGRQPSPGTLQGSRYIREPEQKPHKFIPMDDEFDQAWVGERDSVSIRNSVSRSEIG